MELRERSLLALAVLCLAVNACAEVTAPRLRNGVPSTVYVPDIPVRADIAPAGFYLDESPEGWPDEDELSQFPAVYAKLQTTAEWFTGTKVRGTSWITFQWNNAYALENQITLLRDTVQLAKSNVNRRAQSKAFIWWDKTTKLLDNELYTKITCGLKLEIESKGEAARVGLSITSPFAAKTLSSADLNDTDTHFQDECINYETGEDEFECSELDEEFCDFEDQWYACYFTIWYSSTSLWIEYNECEEIEGPSDHS